MIRRIYAAKLMGIADDDDLERLEAAEQERANLIAAERVAEEYGVGIDEVLDEALVIGTRIQRWGLEAELRRFAQDNGLSDEEARMRYEAAREECGF